MSGILSEASATLGYSFNSRFAAGIGISTIHFVTATPYIYGKVNFSKIETRRIIPFLSLNSGALIYNSKVLPSIGIGIGF
jgi:hypothetical protein